MSLRVDLNIINQKGTPAFYSDTFANRPAAGFAGRVFISTDTGAIYEDTGSTWTLIADAGAGTTGTLQQVTTNGNTTTQGISITAGNLAIGTATAGAPLDIHTNTGTAAQFNGTGTNNAYVFFQNAGASKWRVGNLYNAGANSFEFVDAARSTNVMSLRSTGTYQEVYVNGYNTISNIASFSSAGNYAINPSLTLSIPTTTTFNSGASWSGMATSLLNTWGANNTIDQGAVMSGFIGVNRQSFSTTGLSITLNQGSNGIRAICGMQVLNQTGGTNAGTISHGASLLVQGVYPGGSANVTYTNYYGLLLNQLDEFGTVTFTNRWGIYQGGASDKNYFAANTLIGTTTDSGYKLDVNGTGRFTGALNTSQLIQTADSSTEMKIGRYNSSFPNAYIDAIGPSGDVGFQWRTQIGGSGGGTKMFLTALGNLLIGTTTDNGNKLQVSGNQSIYNGSLIVSSNNRIDKQGTTCVPDQDNSSVTLSSIFPYFNFAAGNDVSLQLQIIATSGASGNATSYIYNCVRTDTGTWTSLLVSTVGSVNPLTLTFTGTTAAPILTITGVAFKTVYYQILQR